MKSRSVKRLVFAGVFFLFVASLDGSAIALTCDPPLTGLIGSWSAEGNANDSAGDNDGTLINGASFATGKVGSAFNFDGSSYVDVPDTDLWTLGSNAFTIDLWLNFSNIDSRSPFIAHDDSAYDYNKWIFWYDESGHNTPAGPALRFHINSDGPYGPIDTIYYPWNPEIGTWYHVAVTRSGNSYALYLNGNQVATATDQEYSIQDASVPLTIGSAEGYFFNGLIDEVDIFNRALSAEEILALYQLECMGSTSTTTIETTTSTTTQPATTTVQPTTSTTTQPAGTPVTADFTGCTAEDAAPAYVQFYDASTGDVQSWEWSFGDGGTSYEQNPLHTYASKGNFTVKLTVTDSDGTSDYKIAEDCVKVGDCPLNADFSGAPTSGTAPLNVQFTDMSTGAVTDYLWAFGDGGSSSEKSPAHTYSTKGDYIVTLKVTGSGCTDTETKTNYIHVTEDSSNLDKLCGILLAVEGRTDAARFAAALRNFRDNRLATSFSGTALTVLYYINSPELMRIFTANPGLKQEVGDIVAACAPRIEQGLEQGFATFTAREIARIENVLQAIEAKGSWLLKLSIRLAANKIKQAAFLEQYGIVVLP